MLASVRLPVFPIPPSLNEAYAEVRGRRLLTDKAKRYKANVANIMDEEQATDALRFFVRGQEAVEMYIHIYRSNWYTKAGKPNRNAGDSDNRVKLLKDAIFNAIGIDDCCVFHDSIRKLPCAEGQEKVVVIITEVVPEVDLF
jgi:Holliday junction resolvase RusA-like endonuclease